MELQPVQLWTWLEHNTIFIYKLNLKHRMSLSFPNHGIQWPAQNSDGNSGTTFESANFKLREKFILLKDLTHIFTVQFFPLRKVAFLTLGRMSLCSTTFQSNHNQSSAKTTGYAQHSSPNSIIKFILPEHRLKHLTATYKWSDCDRQFHITSTRRKKRRYFRRSIFMHSCLCILFDCFFWKHVHTQERFSND